MNTPTSQPSRRRSQPTTPGVILAFIASLAGIAGVRALVHTGAAFEARGWPTVAATIVRSELGEDTLATNIRRYGEVGYTTTTTFLVTYAYEVAGNRLTSSRLDATGSRGIGSAHQLLARYPLGAAVVVHVNREDPTDAVLEAPWPVASLLSCLVGLTAAFFLSRAAHRSLRAGSPPRAD